MKHVKIELIDTDFLNSKNYYYENDNQYQKNQWTYIFVIFSSIIIIVILSILLNYILKFQKIEIYNYKLKNENLQTKENNFNKNINEKLLKEINNTYEKNGYVNINELESKLPNGRSWEKNKYKINEINIGAQLDPEYILRLMITLASIMDSQKQSTKIKFHLGVVLNFKDINMLKIYSLRDKIREDVEFNFYNAKRVEIDLKGLNTKGPGAVAKLLLPQLLPDEIERLLIFDTGDLLVLRDLSELYNWDMKGCLYTGVPGKGTGKYALISKKYFDIYINVGSFLIDVKKVKSENIYEKFVKYKNIYRSHIADQDLLNDIAYGRIGYYPLKFGLLSPFINDKNSDIGNYKKELSFVNNIKYKNIFTFIPKDENELFKLSYNPYVIHQWNGKWMNGLGLTIYRRLAQYYIRYAGIWNEVCQVHPGYCIK